MNGLNRLFLIALAFVVALGAGLGVLLYVSLLPFFHQIGIAMTVLLITGIGCTLLLMVSFTYAKIGILLSDRRRAKNHERLIVHGEVSFYLLDPTVKAESIYHASAMLEQARQPRMIEAAKPEKLEATDETIIELYNDGQSNLEQIADALHLTYYRVQSVIAVAKKKGLIHRR